MAIASPLADTHVLNTGAFYPPSHRDAAVWTNGARTIVDAYCDYCFRTMCEHLYRYAKPVRNIITVDVHGLDDVWSSFGVNWLVEDADLRRFLEAVNELMSIRQQTVRYKTVKTTVQWRRMAGFLVYLRDEAFVLSNDVRKTIVAFFEAFIYDLVATIVARRSHSNTVNEMDVCAAVPFTYMARIIDTRAPVHPSKHLCVDALLDPASIAFTALANVSRLRRVGALRPVIPTRPWPEIVAEMIQALRVHRRDVGSVAPRTVAVQEWLQRRQ